MENQIRVVFDWSRFKRGRILLVVLKVNKKDDGTVEETVVDQELLLKSPLFLKFRLQRKLKRIQRRQQNIALFVDSVSK